MSKIIIPQSDNTLLIQVDNEFYPSVRDFVSKFAVALKTPEHMHIYKIDAVSLWNASVLGFDKDYIISWLQKYSLYDIPNNVSLFIEEQIAKYWSIIFEKIDNDFFKIEFLSQKVFKDIQKLTKFQEFVIDEIEWKSFKISKINRWKLKSFLIEMWYPVEDKIWFDVWEKLYISLKDNFSFRDYQKQAIDSFIWSWSENYWAWTIVLACWWWKTVVAIWVMEKIQTKTLIITTTANACYQFKNEILTKTNLKEEQVWVFVWDLKELRDITITTYSMLTFTDHKTKEFKYIDLFEKNNWWLLIYDEVHTLPAPVFSFSTTLQAKKRLWLTATFIREDWKENLIFWLIWPKRFDMPWKDLEDNWFIAKARCIELRIPMWEDDLNNYYNSPSSRERFKISSCNSLKVDKTIELLEKHKDDQVLIIGEYIEQLEEIAKKTWVQIITWKVKPAKREEIFKQFRTWKINKIILSRVANFAIDLPDANVLIQISWLYGSRQEEAQRLGRILRPKKWKNEASFYSIVSNDTVELHYFEKRQLFLIEQWYEYDIIF